MWIATGMPSAPARSNSGSRPGSSIGEQVASVGGRVAEAEALGDLEAARAQLVGVGELGGHRLAVVLAQRARAGSPASRRRRSGPPLCAAAASCVSSMWRGGPGYIPDRLTTPSMPHSSIRRTRAVDAVGPDVRVDVDAVEAARARARAGDGPRRRRRRVAVRPRRRGRAAADRARDGAARERRARATATASRGGHPPPAAARRRGRASRATAPGTSAARPASGSRPRASLPSFACFRRLRGRGRRLQLHVDLERAPALAARPVSRADHALVRLESVLLDRDRVRRRRVDVLARKRRRADRDAVDDHLGARGRRRDLEDRRPRRPAASPPPSARARRLPGSPPRRACRAVGLAGGRGFFGGGLVGGSGPCPRRRPPPASAAAACCALRRFGRSSSAGLSAACFSVLSPSRAAVAFSGCPVAGASGAARRRRPPGLPPRPRPRRRGGGIHAGSGVALGCRRAGSATGGTGAVATSEDGRDLLAHAIAELEGGAARRREHQHGHDSSCRTLFGRR